MRSDNPAGRSDIPDQRCRRSRLCRQPGAHYSATYRSLRTLASFNCPGSEHHVFVSLAEVASHCSCTRCRVDSRHAAQPPERDPDGAGWRTRHAKASAERGHNPSLQVGRELRGSSPCGQAQPRMWPFEMAEQVERRSWHGVPAGVRSGCRGWLETTALGVKQPCPGVAGSGWSASERTIGKAGMPSMSRRCANHRAPLTDQAAMAAALVHSLPCMKASSGVCTMWFV